jgi:hypothetical protein
MKLFGWKTVQSREGRPDEFYISVRYKGKSPFIFNLSIEEAESLLGDEVKKITGICVTHPIKLTLFIKEDENA